MSYILSILSVSHKRLDCIHTQYVVCTIWHAHMYVCTYVPFVDGKWLRIWNASPRIEDWERYVVHRKNVNDSVKVSL